MSELTPQQAVEITAHCEAHTAELAGVLGEYLGAECTVSVGEAGEFDAQAMAQTLAGAGLAILLSTSAGSLAAVLPESTAPTTASDDSNTQDAATSLASTLGPLLLPESFGVQGARAARVEQLGASLNRAAPAEKAVHVPLTITAGEQTTELSLVGPLTAPAELLAEGPGAGGDSPAADGAPSADDTERRSLDFARLPHYSRSLLKVRVPVRVVLASKRESVQEVVEMAPGTVIKFKKACDEMLHLYIGNQCVAVGEAVKVGDKFGFRVHAMTEPKEHFLTLRPRNAG